MKLVQKSPQTTFRWLAIWFPLMLLILLTTWAVAADYYLEYYLAGLDGALSQTLDYQIIDLLKIEGVSSVVQSSDDYSIGSIIGLTEETSLRASNWMLYE